MTIPSDSSGAAQASPGPHTPVRLPAVLLLGAVLLASWSLYALLLRPLLPEGTMAGEAALEIFARLLFWVAPCSVYLAHQHRARWAEPMGLGFPYGKRQMLHALAASLVVGALLLLGTAHQLGTSFEALASALLEQAEPRFTAPLFEELVFRGVITSEALSWARQSARSPSSLRLRFWGAQLGSAILFTLVHWPSWMLEHGFAATLGASLPLFTTGLVLGFVFAHTRSLWPCVLLHWLNNELSVLVL